MLIKLVLLLNKLPLSLYLVEIYRNLLTVYRVVILTIIHYKNYFNKLKTS